MKVTNEKINDDVQMISWDGQKAEEELLIRMMLMGNVFKVLEDHEVAVLRKIFLNNTHRFTRYNRSFWKLILDISDDELDECTEKSFREDCKMFPY